MSVFLAKVRAVLPLTLAALCACADHPSASRAEAEPLVASERALVGGVPATLGHAVRVLCDATAGLGWPGRERVCSATSPASKTPFSLAIDSLAWWPPRAPRLRGPTAPNDRLVATERLAEGAMEGPEDVAVDAQGRIYGGTADGSIMRLTLTAQGAAHVETFAVTEGRPLGMVFAPDGRLLVAVAEHGLVAIEASGRVTTLVSEVDGRGVAYADGVDVTSEGVVYFSDASDFAFEDYQLDALDARPRGRLIRHDLRTGENTVVLPELYFPNGVALSADQSYLVFTETPRYQLSRFWIEGSRAGTREVIAENLPGFPDGVSLASDGTFWVALFSERNTLLDAVHPLPLVKNILASLPASLQPKPARYGFVLRVDGSGSIVESLQDPEGDSVANITSVRERGGFLYLGSTSEPFVGRLPAP